MKITKKNYFKVIDGLDLKKLPLVLKQSHALILTKTGNGEDWSKYKREPDFRRMTQTAFKKLEEYLDSQSLGAVKKYVSALEESALYDIVAVWKLNKVKPRDWNGMRSIPFTYGNITIDITDGGVRIDMINKKWIDKTVHHSIEELYESFDDMTTLAHYQFRVLKGFEEELAEYKLKPGRKTVVKTSYADIYKECMFIERFLAFHDQVLNKNTFGTFIDDLHKAIEAKNIRKTSPVAKDILAIQHAVVRQFNTMHHAAHFVLKPETIKRLKVIIAKWQNAQKDIDQDYVASKKKSIGLNGITRGGNPAVISSTDFANKEFKTIGFTGKWRALIGDPCPGFKAAVSGMPKMGKSFLCLEFAKYLASNHGKAIYITKEEFMSPTFQLKLKETDAANPNLDIAGEIPADLSAYQYIFIDSVTSLKLTPDDLKKLEVNNPGKSFIYVHQVTKAGKARGTNEFMHNVDIIIEVPERGKAIQYGRYNQGGEMDIFQSKDPAPAVEGLDGINGHC